MYHDDNRCQTAQIEGAWAVSLCIFRWSRLDPGPVWIRVGQVRERGDVACLQTEVKLVRRMQILKLPYAPNWFVLKRFVLTHRNLPLDWSAIQIFFGA
ncbi:MAG: hypothetical protein A2498_08860 [Lentisphaerae bacterium RIFOXYC12_FULL_60_16]|nr:MAG: hypothetical protein A2498_08860 [Lentisphaerae bacterium RIFOXYC12_FULL_60_16]OGV81033.1 MAG: hypothetical protein A2340_07225 [Lentisphaerae bacterium RIFOXYB12_FULL_60_10]